MVADDGARLQLDDKIVVEGLTPDGVNMVEANVELEAGPHAIKVDYFQNGGGKVLELFWQPPDGPLQPVAPRYLLPALP